MNEESPVSRSELLEEEKARIRAEMRYAIAIAQAATPPKESKTLWERVFGYLSNGFVLLILGSIITSYLVPNFQRAYEDRTRQSALKQECLTQFLLYANSIWQEFYAILPLTLETDMTREEYVKYMNDISVVKLKRYDAYAKVEALALAFREEGRSAPTPIEEAVAQFAIRVNEASQAIDTWLGQLYCTPTKRDKSPCATFDPGFDAYGGYLSIRKLILSLGNEEAQKVAEMMVESIKSSPGKGFR